MPSIEFLKVMNLSTGKNDTPDDEYANTKNHTDENSSVAAFSDLERREGAYKIRKASLTEQLKNWRRSINPVTKPLARIHPQLPSRPLTNIQKAISANSG